MRFNPVPFAPYNPYLNPTLNATKTRICKYNNVSNIDGANSAETQNSYSLSKSTSSISQMVDAENNKWTDPNNVNQDSVVSIGHNYIDLQSSIIKSGNLFHHFAEQSDSGIDISKSSNSSSARYFISSKCSSPTTSTMISDKKIKFSISENSLFSDEYSQCETASNVSTKFNASKSFKSSEKNNVHNISISPNNNACSLKYRKNIHYIQNNTSIIKKTTTPKRYVKWRKTNSCTSVHKMATIEKYKFMRTRSYPDILKCEEQYSDTFLHNAADERNRQLSKSRISIFSKISHFSFCPTFLGNKQDISTSDSYCLPPEKTLFKKKYTSLSNSFPIPTNISNTKHSSRSIFTSNEKSCNITTASHDTKTDCTDLKTQETKSLFVVLLLLSFRFTGNYIGCGDSLD